MYLSARDMLKIGYLMLNQGKYNEKQIVPKEWIKEMVSLHTEKCDDQDRLKIRGYGYLWWGLMKIKIIHYIKHIWLQVPMDNLL